MFSGNLGEIPDDFFESHQQRPESHKIMVPVHEMDEFYRLWFGVCYSCAERISSEKTVQE